MTTTMDADLPEGWRLVELGSLVSSRRSTTVDPLDHPTEEFDYFSIPAYQAGGRPLVERGSSIRSVKLLVRPGTVLFGKLNPRVPKVWLVSGESPRRRIASTEFIPLEPIGDVDSRFLYYLAMSRSVLGQSLTLVSGSTPSRQRVNPLALMRLPVLAPPLPEQRAMATVLRTVEIAREASAQVIAASEELKRSLMRYLFSFGPVAAASTLSIEHQVSGMGAVPAHWTVCPLGDVATLQRGFDITKEVQIAGPYPVVSSSGPTSLHADYKVTGPGVVVGRKGSVGRVHFVGQDFWPHDTTLWVKDFHGYAPEFVFRLLEQFDFKPYVTGVANPTLNRNHVHPVTVGVPPGDDAKEICRALDAADAKLQAAISVHDALDRLFATLLELMTSGRFRASELARPEATLS